MLNCSKDNTILQAILKTKSALREQEHYIIIIVIVVVVVIIIIIGVIGLTIIVIFAIDVIHVLFLYSHVTFK